MKKHKVCHITTVHPRYDVRIFEKECSGLAKAGFEVHLIVADGKGNEVKNGVIFHDIGKPSGRINRMIKYPKLALKKALEIDAELYHFHDPELIKTGIALHNKSKKVIYDIHEDLPRQILQKNYIPEFIRKSLSYIVENWENKNAKLLDGLVTATDFIKNRFDQINHSTITIKNYPITEAFFISTQKTKESSVCYIGGISQDRGIIYILDALSNAPYKFHLAGKFQPSEFKDIVFNHYNSNLIEYHGILDRKGIAKLLAGTSIGIVTLLPTGQIKESLPVKMFEYMAAGIPVIASDFPLWKEIVEGNNAGICVDPQNPDEIAKAINKIINNPELAETMGQNGRKLVETNLNWATQEKKLIEFYNKLLS